eukprot:580794_1
MEQLVRFRMLSSTLSLDEYRALLSNVLTENNMEEFSSMIFKHCLKRLKASNDMHGLQIDTINQEIAHIISQRKSNPTFDHVHDDDISDDKSDIHQPLNITDCGDNLIQEIASFLPFKSYSNFQCCCRSIFYAANSPSSLYELDSTIDLTKCLNPHCQSMHQIQLFMKRFERVQKLSIARKNEKYISMLRFRNLKHLQLRSPFTLYHYDTYNINFDTITHLDICNDPSLDFIKRCKNLLSLDFAGVTDVDATFSLSQQFANLECLPNLNHLALRSQTYVDTRIVLKDICNTLQSLAIYSPKHKVEGLTFTNLVELYLGQASAEEII